MTAKHKVTPYYKIYYLMPVMVNNMEWKPKLYQFDKIRSLKHVWLFIDKNTKGDTTKYAT